MHSRRRFLEAGVVSGAASLGVLSTALSPRAAYAQQAESILEKVQRTKEIRVNVIANSPPMFVKDPSSGEWTGSLYEMATNIAQAVQAKPVPVETQWANLALDLQARRIDMAIGVSPTPARALVVDYALSPLYTNYWVIIAKKNPDLARSWAGLNTPNARIGLELGTGQDAFVARMAPSANITRYRSMEEGMLGLQAGRVDMYVESLTNALTLAGRRPDLGKVVVPTPEAKAPTFVAVPREADKGWLMFVTVTSGIFRDNQTNNVTVVKWLSKFGARPSDMPEGLSF